MENRGPEREWFYFSFPLHLATCAEHFRRSPPFFPVLFIPRIFCLFNFQVFYFSRFGLLMCSFWFLFSGSFFPNPCLHHSPPFSRVPLLFLSPSLSFRSVLFQSWSIPGSLLLAYSRFLSSTESVPSPAHGSASPASPSHPSWEMNMSPYWMRRPEQGDGARPTSHIFFMHIENMVMSAFALLHGNDAFPSAVPSGQGWCGPKRARSWVPGLVALVTHWGTRK